MAVLKVYCSRAQCTRRLLELFGIKLLGCSIERSGLLDSILYFFVFFIQGCRTLFVGCFKDCWITMFQEFPKVVRSPNSKLQGSVSILWVLKVVEQGQCLQVFSRVQDRYLVLVDSQNFWLRTQIWRVLKAVRQEDNFSCFSSFSSKECVLVDSQRCREETIFFVLKALE